MARCVYNLPPISSPPSNPPSPFPIQEMDTVFSREDGTIRQHLCQNTSNRPDVNCEGDDVRVMM